MIFEPREWNERQKSLSLLLDQKTFNQGRDILLEMHCFLHGKKVYNAAAETFYDNLWEKLKEETCKIISGKGMSILWCIWHITRIEDLIANIVIAGKGEIFNKDIQKELNIKIKDTGNAITHEEMENFNKNINIKALKEYRNKVGKSTKKIINGLEYSGMKIKAEKGRLEKIYKCGGVIDATTGLLDFWGKKNIFGLIMMPITRHQRIHLNDCVKIKSTYNKL
jgi:hypothetical protein